MKNKLFCQQSELPGINSKIQCAKEPLFLVMFSREVCDSYSLISCRDTSNFIPIAYNMIGFTFHETFYLTVNLLECIYSVKQNIPYWEKKQLYPMCCISWSKNLKSFDRKGICCNGIRNHVSSGEIRKGPFPTNGLWATCCPCGCLMPQQAHGGLCHPKGQEQRRGKNPWGTEETQSARSRSQSQAKEKRSRHGAERTVSGKSPSLSHMASRSACSLDGAREDTQGKDGPRLPPSQDCFTLFSSTSFLAALLSPKRIKAPISYSMPPSSIKGPVVSPGPERQSRLSPGWLQSHHTLGQPVSIWTVAGTLGLSGQRA